MLLHVVFVVVIGFELHRTGVQVFKTLVKCRFCFRQHLLYLLLKT